jgi:hypothetical protein
LRSRDFPGNMNGYREFLDFVPLGGLSYYCPE